MFIKEINKLSRVSKKVIGRPRLKFVLSKPTPSYSEFYKLNKLWLRNSREALGPIMQRELKLQLDNAMSSAVWAWPNQTKRQNGSTVGSPRDIVDTGYLRSSLSQTLSHNATTSTFKGKYKAPYANIVHYGGMIQNFGRPDTSYLPGRPWIKALFEGQNGIPKFAIKHYLQEQLEAEFQKVFG
jgi:phage gpG-like protein